MNTSTIDYDALAKQHGGTEAVDYDALAAQHGGEAVTPKQLSPDEFKAQLDRAKVENAKPLPAQYAPHSKILDLPGSFIEGGAQAMEGVKKMMGADYVDALQQPSQHNLTSAEGLKRVATSLVPPDNQQGTANRVSEGLGNLTGQGILLGGAGKTAEAVPETIANAKLPSPRGIMADRMAEVPAGERFSRQEVLNAARDKGVNLDLAQATDSPAAHSIKKATEYTIGGGASYEANRMQNLSALENWANSEQAKYSPDSPNREAIGGQLQQAIKSHLEARKAVASDAFKELDRTVGKTSVDVTNTVQSEAQKIVDANKAYYEAHPELKPKQAWSVLEDLANRPIAEKAKSPSGLVDESGKPYPGKPQVMADTKSMSWSELHQLRSDLMDVYRNSPDIVKGRSDAWIQQMVGKIDEAMTSGAGGLKGEDLAKFRDANKVWESIKTTYDNPRSPYYQAVRTPIASQVPAMLSRSPELAAQVRQTVGSLEGPFQRQFVENILNAKDGSLDLKNLNTRLRGIPDDLLTAMVGAEGAKQLRLLGKVAQKVTADSNPSGTAKHVVRTTEVVNALHNPVAGAAEIGGTYAAGKAMVSHHLIDLLTKPRGSR